MVVQVVAQQRDRHHPRQPATAVMGDGVLQFAFVVDIEVFLEIAGQVLQDDVLARLLTFPNILITSHQGFLTREALAAIARTTLDNVSAFEQGHQLVNEVLPTRLRGAERPAG